MAFENELKYVIKNDDKVEKTAAKFGPLYQINQKYISRRKNFTLRLRKETCNFEMERYLTFKKAVKGDIVEIEKAMQGGEEATAFDMLWDAYDETNIVKKDRYKRAIAEEEWVIDFFKSMDKDGNSFTYFVVAEVEMPKNQKKPLFLPRLLVDNILYEVPQTDNGTFSSRKLGDVAYASDLYKSLLS